MGRMDFLEAENGDGRGGWLVVGWAKVNGRICVGV